MPIYHGIRAIHGDRYNSRMAALPVTLEDKRLARCIGMVEPDRVKVLGGDG